MILVVDNYDSFTFNLVQALQAAGAEVTVLRNDAIDREGVERLADDPDAHLRGIVISPGPRRPGRRGRVRRHDPRRGRSRDPAPGRLPRDAVDGPGLRCDDRPSPDARPRRGVRGHPRRVGAAGGDAAVVHGGPLPLPVDRSGDAPHRAAGHGDVRVGPRDHGHPPRRRCRSKASSSTRRACSRPRARTCSRTSSASPAKARRAGSMPRAGRSPPRVWPNPRRCRERAGPGRPRDDRRRRLAVVRPGPRGDGRRHGRRGDARAALGAA